MDPGENVLNLVISGMPSIPSLGFETQWSWSNGFKPYYNWTAFNTYCSRNQVRRRYKVLNLVISGIPSILKFQVGLEIEVELF